MKRHEIIDRIATAHEGMPLKELREIHKIIEGTEFDIYPIEGRDKFALFEPIYLLQLDITNGDIQE